MLKILTRKRWNFGFLFFTILLPVFPLKALDVSPVGADFFASHDLVWNTMPPGWESGAFQGNGLIGAMISQAPNSRALQWEIGRTDVYFTHKPDDQYRLPIGDLDWPLTAAPKLFHMRLDLWNAVVRGTIQPDGAAAINWTSFTASSLPVQVIQIVAASGNAPDLKWNPAAAVNARLIIRKEPIPPEEVNPAPIVSQEGTISYCLQPLNDGMEFVTAWKKITSDNQELYYLTVAFSQTGQAKAQARTTLDTALKTGYASLLDQHQTWWHRYWSQHWLSMTDTRMESYYAIQLYKLASATRSDAPPLDLMGPWYRQSPWLKTWWNLNIQLTYWPIYAANHLELGEPLIRRLDDSHEALAKNATPFENDSFAIGRTSGPNLVSESGRELCNLPWILHNYWLQYRYSMDEPMLRDRLYPLMKGSANYYIHLLKKGEDGKLHITKGQSPEYHKEGGHADCNIDLALLRWLLGSLIETASKFDLDPKLIPVWKDTLANLTPYPVNDKGLMISADTSDDLSHRHYSHLLMIYPLGLMNWENKADRPLMTKSVDHWLSMPDAFRGFSYTGAAGILTRMGRTEEAEQWLEKWVNDTTIPFPMAPNTLYAEAGPVIETPLSGAAALQEFFLQSWGDKVRVFPSVPKDWPNASFFQMRAEGAFLVSACRISGVTRTIQIKSLAGAPCRLKTDMENPKTDGSVPFQKIGPNLYEIPLKAGETVTLFAGADARPHEIQPVDPNPKAENSFGLK